VRGQQHERHNHEQHEHRSAAADLLAVHVPS
jgi:hypothetical protein